MFLGICFTQLTPWGGGGGLCAHLAAVDLKEAGARHQVGLLVLCPEQPEDILRCKGQQRAASNHDHLSILVGNRSVQLLNSRQQPSTQAGHHTFLQATTRNN